MDADGIGFEWDPNKNMTNVQDHKVDFIDAVQIWGDPNIQERYDHLHSTHNEDHYEAIGMTKLRVLIVVYTDRVHDQENNVRVITARKATSKEAELYYSHTFEMSEKGSS